MEAATRSFTPVRAAFGLLTVLMAMAILWLAAGGLGGAANAATNPNVKIYGTKFLKQTATASGKHNPLLTLGPLAIRAKCIDQGGGSMRLEIQGKSTKASGKVLFADGTTNLTTSFKTLVFVASTQPDGVSSGFDVLYRDGTYRHFQADLYVNGLGKDCVSRLVATNA